MPNKSRQLSKGGKASPPSTRRGSSPSRLVAPVVAVGALLVILIGVVLLTSAGGRSSGSAGPAQVVGRPRLAIDRQQIDFGKVPLGKPVRAVFTRANVGDRPLHILNRPVVEVRQGC